MKYLLSIIFMMCGCSTLGQSSYHGKEKQVMIDERIVSMPRLKNVDYWNSVVNKVVTISNPGDGEVLVIVNCNYVQFSGDMNIIIPAHTTQRILIATTVQYAYNKLCYVDAVIQH